MDAIIQQKVLIKKEALKVFMLSGDIVTVPEPVFRASPNPWA